MSNTYKLLPSGNLENMQTGAIYPPSRSNYLSSSVLDVLVAAGLAKEDRSGLVALTPDNVLLFQDVVVGPTIEEQRIRFNGVVDAAAGIARAKYLTIAPGQEATYTAKDTEAEKYVASGYEIGTLSDYIWLVAECESLGLELTDEAGVKSAVDNILAQKAEWYRAGSAIEKIRRSAKIKIEAELDTSNLQSYVDEALLAFGVV